ncbi:MAG: hypothetical protein RBR34_08275 [Rhodospirillaceae bacterium]|nr:hypothetical protein [Rhodospirillaceae bacterium]
MDEVYIRTNVRFRTFIAFFGKILYILHIAEHQDAAKTRTTHRMQNVLPICLPGYFKDVRTIPAWSFTDSPDAQKPTDATRRPLFSKISSIFGMFPTAAGRVDPHARQT